MDHKSIGAPPPPPPPALHPTGMIVEQSRRGWSGEQRKRERGGREAEDGEEGAAAGVIPRDAHPHRPGLGDPPPPSSTESISSHAP